MASSILPTGLFVIVVAGALAGVDLAPWGFACATVGVATFGLAVMVQSEKLKEVAGASVVGGIAFGLLYPVAASELHTLASRVPWTAVTAALVVAAALYLVIQASRHRQAHADHPPRARRRGARVAGPLDLPGRPADGGWGEPADDDLHLFSGGHDGDGAI